MADRLAIGVLGPAISILGSRTAAVVVLTASSASLVSHASRYPAGPTPTDSILFRDRPIVVGGSMGLMCGRYAVTTDPARLAAEIDARDEVGDGDVAEGSYNVAPTTTVMTVVDRHDRNEPEGDVARRVRAMRWGLVPPWTKELGKGPLLFNARAESVAEKPAFRTSFKTKRALVPMDGWYEWRPGPKGANGRPTKIPYFMSPDDGTRLFMGALWAAWRPARARAASDDSAWLSSTTIITTDAVGKLADIHHRMPLIMPFEYWDAWLDPDSSVDPALLAPPAADLVDRIEIREVSPLVNNVANNGPELLHPL